MEPNTHELLMILKAKINEIGKLTEERKKCLISELDQLEKELAYLKSVMEAISPFTEMKEKAGYY